MVHEVLGLDEWKWSKMVSTGQPGEKRLQDSSMLERHLYSHSNGHCHAAR